MVASYLRERERIFLRWLEKVERLLGRHVDQTRPIRLGAIEAEEEWGKENWR
jgi:hypothetical protein